MRPAPSLCSSRGLCGHEGAASSSGQQDAPRCRRCFVDLMEKVLEGTQHRTVTLGQERKNRVE